MADERLACSRRPSIAVTRWDNFTWRSAAISLSAFQYSTSRLKLVFLPLKTIERLAIADFSISLLPSSELLGRGLLLWGRRKRPGLKSMREVRRRDRKSTRLNSSHVAISYAVFCLKKQKHGAQPTRHHSQTQPRH